MLAFNNVIDSTWSNFISALTVDWKESFNSNSLLGSVCLHQLDFLSNILLSVRWPLYLLKISDGFIINDIILLVCSYYYYYCSSSNGTSK